MGKKICPKKLPIIVTVNGTHPIFLSNIQYRPDCCGVGKKFGLEKIHRHFGGKKKKKTHLPQPVQSSNACLYNFQNLTNQQNKIIQDRFIWPRIPNYRIDTKVTDGSSQSTKSMIWASPLAI